MEALPRSRDATRPGVPQDAAVPASKPPCAHLDASDALLQSLHGLLFHMQAAHDLLPGRPDDAQRALALALASGDATVARSLAENADTSSAQHAEASGATRHRRAGARRLVALTLEQQLRVLREALSLALQHGDGNHIEVDVTSRRETWVIRVRPHR